MSLQTTLSAISSFVWGPPLLILLSGTGLYLTLRLGFLQIRYLPRALSYLFARGANKGKGDVSSFAALCTALAATIGTGNIVGVATAVQAGGPGAIFWMWLVALLGMATVPTKGSIRLLWRTNVLHRTWSWYQMVSEIICVIWGVGGLFRYRYFPSSECDYACDARHL